MDKVKMVSITANSNKIFWWTLRAIDNYNRLLSQHHLIKADIKYPAAESELSNLMLYLVKAPSLQTQLFYCQTTNRALNESFSFKYFNHWRKAHFIKQQSRALFCCIELK
jgi:hypothetical protein